MVAVAPLPYAAEGEHVYSFGEVAAIVPPPQASAQLTTLHSSDDEAAALIAALQLARPQLTPFRLVKARSA